MIEWWWLIPAVIAAALLGRHSRRVRNRLGDPWKGAGRLRTASRLCAVVLLYGTTGTVVVVLLVVSGQAVQGQYSLDSLSKLGPAATALAAIVAFVIGIATVWQRIQTDRREQWWKRTEWALGWAYGEPDEQRERVGVLAVQYQQKSRLARREEIQFLRESVDDAVEHVRIDAIEAGLEGKTVVQWQVSDEDDLSVPPSPEVHSDGS